MRVGWYLTEAMKPQSITSDTQRILTVECRPSTRTVLSVEPTILGTDTMLGEPAAPGYVGFAVCLMQAIPADRARRLPQLARRLPPAPPPRSRQTGVS